MGRGVGNGCLSTSPRASRVRVPACLTRPLVVGCLAAGEQQAKRVPGSGRTHPRGFGSFLRQASSKGGQGLPSSLYLRRAVHDSGPRRPRPAADLRGGPLHGARPRVTAVLVRHALGDQALTAAGGSSRRWPPSAITGRGQYTPSASLPRFSCFDSLSLVVFAVVMPKCTP